MLAQGGLEVRVRRRMVQSQEGRKSVGLGMTGYVWRAL